MKFRWLITAMVCAGAVTAQFVSGKATRDALFFASFDFTSLPLMLVATSACSIALVAANARASRRIAPRRIVPAAFAVSGVLFLVESLLTFTRGPLAAILVYLHVSGVGPVLASGFWLITSVSEVRDILDVRSRDHHRVAEVLRREEGLSPILVPHVIPLLAWEPVAEQAVFAFRKVAEDRVGELVDALLDPNQDFSVRRRLARVFSVCVSQRASDGLMFGLEDPRFDVRFQSARSLASLVEKNPLVRIDRERIETAVLREVAVGRPVWESRRLLDYDVSDAPNAVDAFVRDRAGESLAHVFTLLSLMLPREPLQVAFRSLHTDDQQLQGTALEYLDSVLPPRIRAGLWPFLEDRTPVRRSARPRNEVIAELLRSNYSILMNLEELRRRSAAALELTAV